MRNVALMLPNSCEEIHGLFGEQFCKKKIITTCVVKSQCKFVIYWGNFQSKKVVLEVTKTGTLVRRVQGAHAPAGVQGQRPHGAPRGVFSLKTQ